MLSTTFTGYISLYNVYIYSIPWLDMVHFNFAPFPPHPPAQWVLTKVHLNIRPCDVHCAFTPHARLQAGTCFRSTCWLVFSGPMYWRELSGLRADLYFLVYVLTCIFWSTCWLVLYGPRAHVYFLVPGTDFTFWFTCWLVLSGGSRADL